jgi:Ca2+-binding RTX toxin-like protein
MPVVTDYTALLSGSYWNGIEATGAPVIVTFSFPTTVPTYDASIAGFTGATLSSFQAFSTAEQTQALAALGEWSAASGLIFVQVAPGQGDINFANIDFNTTSSPSYAGAGGIGFYPFGDWSNLSYPNFTSDLDAAGDVFMNTQFQNADGTVNYGTLLHEIGHAIGLKHPTEVVTDFAAEPTPVVHDQVLASDDPSQTIMATAEDSTTGSDSHLQQLDKNAAAFIYGAAGTGGVVTSAASGSNSLVNWSWDPVTQTLAQTALQDNETIRGTSVNDIINGLPGDRLFALDGTDVLNGGGGGDALYGGPGSDTLVGGPGGNSFYVNSTSTTVTENNIGSSDALYATVSFTLPANVDTMYLYGAGLTATGNNDNDTFYGDGTSGQTFVGGTGSDTFNIYNINTTVDKPTNSGHNVIYATLGAAFSYTMPANVQELHVFGTSLTATGNDLNVSIFGDPTNGTTIVAGSGNDYMVGFSGHDVLVAGIGTDTMYGGAGTNRFAFGSIADAPVSADPTTIGDFPVGTDKIDLSAITTPGSQHLTFIGTDPFTGTPGEVRYFVSNGNTFVEGDVTGSGSPDLEIELSGSVTLQASNFALTAACYREGTHMLSDQGEVAIERLAVGDRVVTGSGEALPIVWIGYRKVDCARHPEPRDVWPVRVSRHAFGANRPHRDLWLSPDHGVLVDDVLIPIRSLINGATIQQVAIDVVTWYHIELSRHDIVLAEGLAAESYLDTGNRSAFANAGVTTNLHPVFGPPRSWREHGCAPLVDDAATVRPVWTKLAERARALGLEPPEQRFDTDPKLNIALNGRRIAPFWSSSNAYKFILPSSAAVIDLVSRTGHLTDRHPWATDRRQLGVCVHRIILHGSHGPHEIALDDPSLMVGWWHVESASDRPRRWTNGRAALPVPRDAIVLEVRLAGTIRYLLDDVIATAPACAA